MYGSMVFDEEWWVSNETFSWSSGGRENPPTPPGLLSFSFGGGLPGDSSTADYEPYLCGVSTRPCSSSVLGQMTAYGYYDFDLTIGSLLAGYASVNDTGSNVRMASSGSPVWTIETFRTDGLGPYPCILGDVCGGGTGLWVLDLSTAPIATPVPEPETVAMWLAGAFLVGIALRPARRGPAN
jgi:hypothetical protein